MSNWLRRLAGLALGVCASLVAYAQPAPIKFGKPDPKDFEVATFDHDSAAAVVLCDYGTSTLHMATRGRQLDYERTCRIKILRKAGFKWATVEIPVFSSWQKLISLRGFTYNLVNGVVVQEKLESKAQNSNDVTRYMEVRSFSLPNVREGSVIEFKYNIVELYASYLPDWRFQSFIPVRMSEYRVSFPNYLQYRFLLQGYVFPTAPGQPAARPVMAEQSAVGEYQRWVMKDVPAFVEEPYLVAPHTYMARLRLELIDPNLVNYSSEDLTTAWNAVDQRLRQHPDFGQALEGNAFLKAVVASVPPLSAPVAERAAAVHALVRDAVKYDGHNSLLADAPLRRTFLETHQGGSADINLLLIAALRTAGIDANPLVLSTRDYGRVNVAIPTANGLNYVLAHVTLPDGQDLLLDATEPLLPAGMLPERCLSQLGRLVLKTGVSRWLDIKPSQRRTHFQQVKLSLAADGTLRGTVHEEYVGYAAAAQRADLQQLGEPKYRSQFASQHTAWTVPVFTVTGRTELAKPLAFDYEFAQASDGGTAGTFYLALLDEFMARSNPFRHESRTYPVDFATAQEETVMLTLTLPAGYEVNEMPKPTIVDLPDNGGRYLFKLAATGAEVQLVSRLNLRKPVYSVEEYEHLREFYRLMLEKQAEKLVIKKKA